MAANDAILASLLLGQRQRESPLDIYRKYGQTQLQAGSSTAPLGSGNPLEGIARALQGGIGGLIQGYALNRQQAEDDATSAGLQKASIATTPQEWAEAMKGVRGSEGNAALGQIAQGRLNDILAQQQAGRTLGPLGVPVAAAGAAPAMPQVQQGGGAAPAPDASGFANNSGNIRSTAPGNVNGFATYPTPQAGANAHFQNYQAYVQQNPNITVAQALAKWSPPNENDTNGIISQISEATGINPAMPLADVLKDPALAATLLEAQTRREKGGIPAGFNSDTFMAAAGGPQAAPGNPGQIVNVPAQGSGPTPTPQPGPPTAQSSPAGDQLRQRAQAFAQTGNMVEAQKYAKAAIEEDAKWANEIGKKNIDQVEWDRQQAATNAARQPQETVQNEAKLREQFDQLQSVKDYRKAATVFRSAVDAVKTNTAAADLNVVYAFATLMDPGSVVRDAETGMVTATQSASDRVKALVASVSGGSRLSPESKAALLNEMGSRYESYKIAHDDLSNTFRGIATRSQVNPDNVVAPYPSVKWKTGGGDPSGGAAPPGGEVIYDMHGKPVNGSGKR